MMKKFNLLVSVYRGINRLEEKIIRPHRADYEASLSKHLVIIPFVSLAVAFLVDQIEMQLLLQDVPQFVIVLISSLPWVALTIYWMCYVRPRLPLLNTRNRKIGYGFFSFFFMVILGPCIFPLLLAVILLTIAIKIALILFSIAVWFISLFSGGSRKGEITLDDGTVVKNKKGLFGEDNYEAVRNGTGTYDRSGDIFTKR